MPGSGASSMCANLRAANFCNRREIQIDELELYAIGAHIVLVCVPNTETRTGHGANLIGIGIKVELAN